MALQRALITNCSKHPPTSVEVQFNPTEYGVDRGASYAELQVPGLRMPLLQFVRGEASTLNIELFLDGTDTRDERFQFIENLVSGSRGSSVERKLQELRAFVTIDRELHAPPVCRFEWGNESFQGVVTSFRERYTLFNESGGILRARVTLAIKSYEAVEVQRRVMRLQSPDRTRLRVVREGETLAQIAQEAYGDARLWMSIAEANGLDRPRFLTPGTQLVIPAL